MSKFDDIYPLFQEYDMYAQIIDVIKPPNVYKAMTPYGSFVCKRTNAPKGRLQFIGGVLRQLQKRGWNGAVPYTYTKYDEPFLTREDFQYYLTPWQPSVEINEDRYGAWANGTVVRLAELHHLTQNYRFDDPRQVEPLVDSLLMRWEHWLSQMEVYMLEAKSRAYPSPFDVVFVANYAFISDMARSAIVALRDWRERHRTHAHFRLSLIHGNPHPSHTLMDEAGNVLLINFDRTIFDTPIRDLTIFYRTYFQTAQDLSGASELYRSYTSVFPLRPEEVELLASFLHYPERIMRDLNYYYNRRPDWNELYAVKRLEKNIDRLMRLSRWVNQAF